LRFIKSLGDKHIVVLGNHDLHLLAVAYGVRELSLKDTLDDILSAPDRDDLVDWLRHRPLVHHDASLGFVMAHAGIAPAWDVAFAKQLGREVEMALQGDAPGAFLQHMFGDQPSGWDNQLTGADRLRCIVNYLTRMRYCYADGRLELSYKGMISDKPQTLIPWFDVPTRVNKEDKIVFGHWAALGGKADVPNVYPIDTGCAWGRQLTALRLEDEQLFSVQAM
jgi:bis(5'-nucleosyl)-tetraphosphatase (symmetrical)